MLSPGKRPSPLKRPPPDKTGGQLGVGSGSRRPNELPILITSRQLMADRVGTASSGPQHGLGFRVDLGADRDRALKAARDLGARRFSAWSCRRIPTRRGQFALVHSRGTARVVECATGTEARARGASSAARRHLPAGWWRAGCAGAAVRP